MVKSALRALWKRKHIRQVKMTQFAQAVVVNIVDSECTGRLQHPTTSRSRTPPWTSRLSPSPPPPPLPWWLRSPYGGSASSDQWTSFTLKYYQVSLERFRPSTILPGGRAEGQEPQAGGAHQQDGHFFLEKGTHCISWWCSVLNNFLPRFCCPLLPSLPFSATPGPPPSSLWKAGGFWWASLSLWVPTKPFFQVYSEWGEGEVMVSSESTVDEVPSM